MRTQVLHRRLAAVGVAAAGVVLATALPAAAHVGVSSPDAAPGDFGKLVFRVPNESDAADTTKLEVTLPEDTPFAHVSSRTLPGWSVETETTKLDAPVEVAGATISEAVTTVTWTAQKGSAIPPGQFQEFELSVGAFPEQVDGMMFPATQTYSDGEVVTWDQVTRDGAAEPEHPAPVLETASAADTTQVATTSATTGSSGDDADGLARTMGGVAVLLAAGAVLLALLTGRRKPS